MEKRTYEQLEADIVDYKLALGALRNQRNEAMDKLADALALVDKLRFALKNATVETETKKE